MLTRVILKLRVGDMFVEPRTGRVLRLADAWAGGCAWYRFDVLVDGKWNADMEWNAVWFCEDRYDAEVGHDQYETFNSDRPHPDHPDDEAMGGCLSLIHI